MKYLQRLLLTFLLLMGFGATASAYPPAGQCNKEKKASKPQKEGKQFTPQEFRKHLSEFLIKEAQLSAEEAKVALPIFLEMKDKHRELNMKIDRACRRAHFEKLSERDSHRILNEVEKLKRQSAELEISYYEKLTKVLPTSKVLRILSADDMFGKRMFHKMMRKKK